MGTWKKSFELNALQPTESKTLEKSYEQLNLPHISCQERNATLLCFEKYNNSRRQCKRLILIWKENYFYKVIHNK